MEFIDRDSIDYFVAGHSVRDIINYNEYVVLEVVREIFEEEGDALCRCSLCVEDVFALSLNALPPRYIQVTSVRTYQESANFIPTEEIRAKVLDAVGKVKSRPNH